MNCAELGGRSPGHARITDSRKSGMTNLMIFLLTFSYFTASHPRFPVSPRCGLVPRGLPYLAEFGMHHFLQ
jgi:hypothetical protein